MIVTISSTTEKTASSIVQDGAETRVKETQIALQEDLSVHRWTIEVRFILSFPALLYVWYHYSSVFRYEFFFPTKNLFCPSVISKNIIFPDASNPLHRMTTYHISWPQVKKKYVHIAWPHSTTAMLHHPTSLMRLMFISTILQLNQLIDTDFFV